ncbi:MAG: hypothetical protein NTW80_06695 [Deltaproteobacteria bacterium]|nr:hypothetical protein [Deltaproteobacteria bacterium]
MKLSGGRGLSAAVFMLWVGLLGCGLAPAAEPSLTVAAAQATLDSWNPSYCKVAEFHGLYKPEGGGATQVAYVSLVSPSDKAPKLTVYAAIFQLLTKPDGKQQWFLTSLLTHGQGLFVKRQGWDNLMLPVKAVSSKQ